MNNNLFGFRIQLILKIVLIATYIQQIYEIKIIRVVIRI
jgi:hypothetical protein